MHRHTALACAAIAILISIGLVLLALKLSEPPYQITQTPNIFEIKHRGSKEIHSFHLGEKDTLVGTLSEIKILKKQRKALPFFSATVTGDNVQKECKDVSLKGVKDLKTGKLVKATARRCKTTGIHRLTFYFHPEAWMTLQPDAYQLTSKRVRIKGHYITRVVTRGPSGRGSFAGGPKSLFLVNDFSIDDKREAKIGAVSTSSKHSQTP